MIPTTMTASRSAARLRGLVRFLRAVLARFAADRGPSLAASLTYTTLLALVPLLAIGLALMTVFPVFEEFSLATQRFFEENLLPPKVGETVLGYLRDFSAGAGRLTLVGIAALAVSAYFMMHTIETAFNAIWRVRRRRPFALRVLVYLGVVTLGPVLVGASLTTTSYFVTASLGLVAEVPGGQAALLTLAQLLLTSIAFTLLYWVVPNRTVPLRHAAAGGCVTAVLFEVTSRAFGLYIGHVSTYTLLYGAFAVVPLLLVWVYMAWAVALLGAVLTAMLPDYGHAAAAPHAPPLPALADVLGVIRILVRAHDAAGPLSTLRIASLSRVPLERCEVALDALARARWVAQEADGRWALACDPDRTTAAEIYESTARTPPARQPPEIARLLAGTASRVRESLAVPLRALAEEEGALPGPRRTRRRPRPRRGKVS
jgi:membrane protein